MVEKLGASSLLHFHRRSIKYLSIHYLFQAIHHPRCTFCTLTSGGCFFFQLCPGCCFSAFSFMVSVYHCQTGRLVCNVSMILVHTAPSVSVLFFLCLRVRKTKIKSPFTCRVFKGTPKHISNERLTWFLQRKHHIKIIKMSPNPSPSLGIPDYMNIYVIHDISSTERHKMSPTSL